ncbi:thiamine pyrophosphate-dependent dehydrogenase E1 component subunit alpha [Cognatishimia sp.]|uniref:thiamine pyrophosphate-dependent dehydrogenase E1 component subunit alpha n=1 Tax=Cognatishimia sp. TaxID=2211648 RepID=UPI003517C4B0
MTDRRNDTPTPEELRAMFSDMVMIREAETALLAATKLGQTPGQVHLSSGQEAIAVGISAHLTDADQITSTHRGHGHYLAKGGDLRAMFAEIYGFSEGICGGMGGSMHVADFSKGIVGANGIVGAGLPIAAGAAFAHKLDGSDSIAVCYFGDGASNQGVLMECLNITALWELPMLFVCENNGYSEFSPADTVTKGVISDRAKPFDIPVWKIDGNDLEAVWMAAREAIDHIRAGKGPAFIEAQTWRQSGHFSAEAVVLDTPYRTEEQEAAGLATDPITRLAAKIDGSEALIADITAHVKSTAEAALDGTPPDPDAAYKLMFTDRQMEA